MKCASSNSFDSPDDCCSESPLQGSYFCQKHMNLRPLFYSGKKFDFFENITCIMAIIFLIKYVSKIYFNKYIDDFLDIVDDKVIDGIKQYKFIFDLEEKDAWVSENSDLGRKSVHIINDYLKRKSYLASNMSIEKKCCADKTMMCLNKSRTRGNFLLLYQGII